jgi:hypothetical protein
LVGTRVQAEVHHACTTILRGDNVDTTIDVRLIFVVESVAIFLVDVDTMSLESQSINGEGSRRPCYTVSFYLREGGLGLARASIPCNSVINDDLSIGLAGNWDNIISEQGHVMPISPLIGVGR